ncbi:uncharacterized protein EDB93DRAFT_1107592 [Suillus bovinus]|uniref:uncharacterized protein n=1 Tax=Suillus bovinus TaxID=48563 RepID=UPI001B8621D5|nr:uncharacterized protein EDB93DRAFT_1107592 [Suillus bovinus]KAG2133552.1 hypothetical protein EDB93DRAFT_1107592 [Suillus bovinus]
MKNQDQNFTKRKSLTGGTRLRFSFARFTMNFSTEDITLVVVGTENATRATVCGRRRQFGSRVEFGSRVVVCLEDFCRAAASSFMVKFGQTHLNYVKILQPEAKQNRLTGRRPKKDKMVGSHWTSAEQRDYLESQFSKFLKQQLQGTLLNFWSNVSMEFLQRWPEINMLHPDKSPSELSEAENMELGKAVEQLKNWFNYRSRKSGRSQLNAMMKSITKMISNKAKGTWVHTEVEIFSKMNYNTAVRSQIKEKIKCSLLITKNEKLMAVRELTKAAYEAMPLEIQLLCKAKAAEEREAKASTILSETAATRTPTNAQYAKALEECIGPISQFFDTARQLTGWEWTVIGGGPNPRLGSMLNVLSYHTGMNQAGLTWKQTTSNFTDKHLNPYLSYLGTVFTEDDRKKHALDYVPPAEQEENSFEGPTMSDASTSLQAALSLPAVTPMRVPKSLLPFDSPGPSRVSSQGLDDSYSWDFDPSIFSQPPSSLLPWPQTPTLPAFLSMSSVTPLAPPLPDTPITSWRKESEFWNPMIVLSPLLASHGKFQFLFPW